MATRKYENTYFRKYFRLELFKHGLIKSISGYYTSYRLGKSHRCVIKSMFFVRSCNTYKPPTQGINGS